METMKTIKTVTLPAGERVPAFGMGTWYMGEDGRSMQRNSPRFGSGLT